MTEETNVHSTEPTAETQERTFTQAEVDALIQKRLERERKKYPGDEELAAFRAWRGARQEEQDAVNVLTRERDEGRTALSAAQAERDRLKQELYVLKKGFSGEEAEFIAFKAGRLTDDQTTFEQAVDALAAGRRKTTFDWTAPVGGGSRKTGENDMMNALIRGALT